MVAFVLISVSKLVPSSTKPVAVMIPAFPSFILLPTLTKSSNTPLSATMLPVTLPVTPPENDAAVTIPEKFAPPYTFKVAPVPTPVSYTHLTLPTKRIV